MSEKPKVPIAAEDIYGRAAKLNMKFDHSIISSIATSRAMVSNLDLQSVCSLVPSW